MDKKSFDKIFQKLLLFKKRDRFIDARFNVESLPLDARPDFVIQLLLSFEKALRIIHKILFWEEDTRLLSFMESHARNRNYSLTTSYKGRGSPGIIYMVDESIDKIFLAEILKYHFNYEPVQEPSFDMQLQTCIDHKEFAVLIDIYDDRGFDMSHFPKSSKQLSFMVS